MKEKIKHYIKEIIIFVIVMSIVANVVSFYKSFDLNKGSLDNMNLTLIDNTIFKQDNKKPIIIHFWATWCPTCSLESSNIQYISKSYEVLTVAVKSNDKDIGKYMLENNLDFKVYNDKEAKLARKFNIAVYPTTFIYDENRNLVFSEVGYTSTFGLWIRMWWASL
ncbi:MAG: redoxin domain-containing protein [Campylobacterota bacterium]|nr:redoxin domain-containing protein [Campylobacterota bacterium]